MVSVRLGVEGSRIYFHSVLMEYLTLLHDAFVVCFAVIFLELIFREGSISVYFSETRKNPFMKTLRHLTTD